MTWIHEESGNWGQCCDLCESENITVTGSMSLGNGQSDVAFRCNDCGYEGSDPLPPDPEEHE